MFYCTLYYVKSKKFSGGVVEFCLSYDSENSARAYQQVLLGDAAQLGATVEKQDGYYYIEGKIELSPTGGFVGSNYNNRFAIYLETDDTVGAKDTTEYNVKDRVMDGLDFERRMRKWKELKAQMAKEETEKVNKHLADFKAAIENTDLRATLKTLIKYSQYVKGKYRDSLIDIVIDKLQGNTNASGWYDELSDINN